MTQGICGHADNGLYILLECRVVDRMHPHRHPRPTTPRFSRRLRQASESQLGHHQRMIKLATGRCAVLAVECHVKGAGAKFFGHRRLQDQTFVHPGFHTTVVIADRDRNRSTGRPQEHLTGRLHGAWSSRARHHDFGIAA